MLNRKKIFTLVLLGLFSQMSFAQSNMCDELKAEIEANKAKVTKLRSELNKSAEGLGIAKSLLETAQKESEKYNKPASIALTVGAGVVTIACGAMVYKLHNAKSSGLGGFLSDVVNGLVGIPVFSVVGASSGIYAGTRVYKSIVTRDKLEDALKSLEGIQTSYEQERNALNEKEGFLDGLRDGYDTYCK